MNRFVGYLFLLFFFTIVPINKSEASSWAFEASWPYDNLNIREEILLKFCEHKDWSKLMFNKPTFDYTKAAFRIYLFPV